MADDRARYPYSEADPRFAPGLYMYPPFEGEELLAAHRRSRDAALAWLARRAARDASPVNRRPGPIEPVPLPGTASVRTVDLLAALGEAARDPGSSDPTAAAWVAVLARKVETARVLRAGYGPDLRPSDRDEAPLDAYAHLADLLARRCGPAPDAGLLSTLIKIDDVLDHVLATDPAGRGMLSPTGARAARRAIEVELALVGDLAQRRGRLPGAGTSAREARPPNDGATPGITGPGSRRRPTRLAGLAMLAADTGRARAYVDLLLADGLTPERAVVLEVPGASDVPARPHATPLFDNVTTLRTALVRADVPTQVVTADHLAAATILDAVAALDQSIVVVAGPAGGILGEAFFRLPGKRYLHVHPGRLPAYRGSTPMYYSLLAEGRLSATALFLDERLDAGLIVAERDFPPPVDRRSIDLEYDPWMRAVLLRDVLRRHAAGESLEGQPQSEVGARTYFVIHPVLRHIAVLAG